ncbi:unnamed protein product, partial [Nesidiocoris tenuis]
MILTIWYFWGARPSRGFRPCGEAEDCPFCSPGFWAGSLGCNNLCIGLVPIRLARRLMIIHPFRASTGNLWHLPQERNRFDHDF